MINVAILGTGFGKYHAELYKNIEGFNIKYIFGRDIEKLNKIENTLSIQATDDIEPILNDDEIDLIDICLPTELHKEYAIKGLHHGKHVFCETPITFSSEDARDIKLTAEQCEKHVYVDLFTKFSSPHKFAIDYLKNNSPGKPISYHSYNKTSRTWGDLSLKKNVFNFYIHNMDFLLEIMGMPKEVFSHGVSGEESSSVVSTFIYDEALATVTSHSNLPDNSPFGIGYEIICINGSVTFHASYGEENSELLLINVDKSNQKIQYDTTNDYEEVIKHLKTCLLENKKSSFLDIDNAISSLKLAEFTHKSLLDKKVLQMDVSDLTI